MSCLKFKSFDSITRYKISGKLWPMHWQTFKTLWHKTQFVSSSKHSKSKQKPLQLSLHLPLNFLRKIVKNENTMDQFTHVSSVQSCLTLCDPMDCSMPRLPVHYQLSEFTQNSRPLSQWCHPTISSFVVPFSSCPQSLPASGSFPMSQLFTWGGQSIRASASTSVLPMNTQDWSPLGWTGWISLQSKGLSRVFSNTTVQKHQLFGTQLSL